VEHPSSELATLVQNFRRWLDELFSEKGGAAGRRGSLLLE
jgi:hypothetical protein